MRENFFQNNTPTKKETPPVQKVADLEHSIEKENALEKTRIMEEAREERLNLLSEMLSVLKDSMEVAQEKIGINRLRKKINDKLPKPAQELLSQVMDASSLKMYIEATTGKSLVGEDLTPMDRILSLLSGATNDIAKLLFAYAASSGSKEYARLGSMLYGTSWALLLAKNGQKMMRNLQELAQYYEVNSASLVLAKIEETFYKYRYPGFEGKFEPISE